ncbi:MAG: hypothetical protein LZ172_08470 [Thaumarchaeota archaeon]|jgi:hypothetical protein|nr:hypothetical protein [Candidatus Geocrenenecus arthurdayi]
MKSKVVVEVAEFRDREGLEELASRAMKILEESEGDESIEYYANGWLAISKTLAKVYSFRWPAKVFVGWIFEDPKTAEEIANIFRNVFTKVEKKWRSINGRRLPLIMIDWEEWMEIFAFTGNPLNPLDIIAFRYLRNTRMEKALKQLARDLAGFFEEYSGEVEGGVIEDD